MSRQCIWNLRDTLRIDILIWRCTWDKKKSCCYDGLYDVEQELCSRLCARLWVFFVFTLFHSFSILVSELFHSLFLTLPFFLPHQPSHNKNLTFPRNKGLSPHAPSSLLFVIALQIHIPSPLELTVYFTTLSPSSFSTDAAAASRNKWIYSS